MTAPQDLELCHAHGLPLIVSVGGVYGNKQYAEDRCCVCFASNGDESPLSLWMDGRWIPNPRDRDLIRAWCLQTGHDEVDAAEAIEEISLLRLEAGCPDAPALQLWIMLVTNPDLDRTEIARLTALGARLGAYQHLGVGDVSGVREVVDRSRRRWDTHFATLWERLDEPVRGWLCELGTGPLSEEQIAGLNPRKMEQFMAAAVAVFRERPLEVSDFSAWGARDGEQSRSASTINVVLMWLSERGGEKDSHGHGGTP